MANETNQVKQSIDQLSSSMKKLVLMQMTQLSNSASEYADDMERAYKTQINIDNLQNKIIKKLKEENRLEEYHYKIEEKLSKLRKEEVAADKTRAILEEKIKKLSEKKLENEKELLEEIKELREDGLEIDEKDISSQEELIKFLNHKKNIITRNVQISKEQYKELEKQIKKYKEGNILINTLGSSLKKGVTSALNSAGNALKGWISQLASFASIGYAIDRSVEHLKAYNDGMWNLGITLKGNNDGIFKLNRNIGEVETSFRKATVTAARFGISSDTVREAMNQLSTKVHFLKRELNEGIYTNRLDVKRLGEVTEVATVFARTMGMDVSEAIDMYSTSIRKMGFTHRQAIKQMSKLQTETIGFNSILVNSFSTTGKAGEEGFENVAMFANEIGRAMLELQQGTRYWVQDLQMLNTQFNAYINLLIRQGKSQQQALATAKSFQKTMTEPGSELVQYRVGSELANRVRGAYKQAKKENKNISKEELTLKGAESLGLAKVIDGKLQYINKQAEDTAKSVYYMINERKGKDTGVSLAKFMQQAVGGTEIGMDIAFGIMEGFKNFDIGVFAKSLGYGENEYEAVQNLRLAQELKEYGLHFSKDAKELARALATMDITKQYGGLTKEGKATQELLDAYLEYSSTNTADKIVQELDKSDLTLEEKAVKFRAKKIEELLSKNNETLESSEKIDEKGVVKSDIKGFEESVDKKLISLKSELSSIYWLLAGSLAVQSVNAIGSLAPLGKSLKSFLTKERHLPKLPWSKSKTPKVPDVKDVVKSTNKIKLKIDKTPPKGGFNYRDIVTKGKQNATVWDAAKNSKQMEKVAQNLKVSSEISKKSAQLVEKSSAKVIAKTGGKLGAKIAGKFGVGTDAAMGLGFAYSRLKGGDKVGAAAEAFSGSAKYIGATIGTMIMPGIGTAIGAGLGTVTGFLTDGVLAIRDYIDKDKLSLEEKASAFEEFNKVTSSIALLPENIDNAIEEYTSKINGLTEEGLSDLKESLKNQYIEALNESKDTKNPEAILLRKKIEYGDKNKEKILKQQLAEEKEAYKQLDDVGKILTKVEKLYDLQDKWFSFDVETEVRKVMTDTKFTENQRYSLLKAMSKGAGGGYDSAGNNRFEVGVDASGVQTIKFTRNKMVGAQNIIGMDFTN